jgi:hypothetical protein
VAGRPVTAEHADAAEAYGLALLHLVAGTAEGTAADAAAGSDEATTQVGA